MKPNLPEHAGVLKASQIETTLGSMIAIANDDALYLLEFLDRRSLESEIEYLKQKTKASIIPSETQPIHSIRNELCQYFNGKLSEFKTPLCFAGSAFQRRVWQTLKKIPFGTTQSYADIAKTIGQPSAFRAVARANSTNQIAIVIPCHRVIHANGKIGGYSSGVSRKQWLIRLEKESLKS